MHQFQWSSIDLSVVDWSYVGIILEGIVLLICLWRLLIFLVAYGKKYRICNFPCGRRYSRRYDPIRDEDPHARSVLRRKLWFHAFAFLSIAFEIPLYTIAVVDHFFELPPSLALDLFPFHLGAQICLILVFFLVAGLWADVALQDLRPRPKKWLYRFTVIGFAILVALSLLASCDLYSPLPPTRAILPYQFSAQPSGAAADRQTQFSAGHSNTRHLAAVAVAPVALEQNYHHLPSLRGLGSMAPEGEESLTTPSDDDVNTVPPPSRSLFALHWPSFHPRGRHEYEDRNGPSCSGYGTGELYRASMFVRRWPYLAYTAYTIATYCCLLIAFLLLGARLKQKIYRALGGVSLYSHSSSGSIMTTGTASTGGTSSGLRGSRADSPGRSYGSAGAGGGVAAANSIASESMGSISSINSSGDGEKRGRKKSKKKRGRSRSRSRSRGRSSSRSGGNRRGLRVALFRLHMTLVVCVFTFVLKSILPPLLLFGGGTGGEVGLYLYHHNQPYYHYQRQYQQQQEGEEEEASGRRLAVEAIAGAELDTEAEAEAEDEAETSTTSSASTTTTATTTAEANSGQEQTEGGEGGEGDGCDPVFPFRLHHMVYLFTGDWIPHMLSVLALLYLLRNYEAS